MKAGIVSKSADAIVFISAIYFGIQFYMSNSYFFDLIGLAGVAYIALRKPDINTITLILVLLVTMLTPAVFIYSAASLNNYWLHSLLLIINVAGVILIWMRPFLLLKYGPLCIKQNKNIAVTRQDWALGYLFTFQGLWQLVLLIEHVIRHLDDIGLDGLFGDWTPMHFYSIYEVGQFGFSIFTLMILYFLTFDKSKETPNARLGA